MLISENATKPGHRTEGEANFIDRLIEYIKEHDQKIVSKLENGLHENSSNSSYKKNTLETLEKMETHFQDPKDRQFFEFIKQQAIATSEANAAFFKKKISSKIETTILELQTKAASKVNQGVDKLLTSQ